jgi:hypothetical protein
MFGEALYGEILFGGKRANLIERVLNLPIAIFNFVSKTGGFTMFIRGFIERIGALSNSIRKFIERIGGLVIFIRKYFEKISSFPIFFEGIKQVLKAIFYPIKVRFRVKNQ